MQTPFGVIQTENRPTTDQLHDIEHRQTERLGDALTAIGRQFRGARTVRDVLEADRLIHKLLGAELPEVGDPEPNNKALADLPKTGIATPRAAQADESAAIRSLDTHRELHQLRAVMWNVLGFENAEDASEWIRRVHSAMRRIAADHLEILTAAGVDVVRDLQLPGLIRASAIANETAGIFERLVNVFGAPPETEIDREQLQELMERAGSAMRIWAETGMWPGTGVERLWPAIDNIERMQRGEIVDDPEVTRDMILLLGDYSPAAAALILERVTAWTPEQRAEVDEYAGAVHLSASDHPDVLIPAQPQILTDLITEVQMSGLSLVGGPVAAQPETDSVHAESDDAQAHRQGNEPEPPASAPTITNSSSSA